MVLNDTDTLNGADALPGFTLPWQSCLLFWIGKSKWARETSKWFDNETAAHPVGFP